jgi:hypothetical protein
MRIGYTMEPTSLDNAQILDCTNKVGKFCRNSPLDIAMKSHNTMLTS